MINPTKIDVQQGERLIIEWHDGRVDTIEATDLRAACPCASCRSAPLPLPPPDPETCHLTKVSMVGAYAINVVFAPDGHATGIYSYTILREIGD
jgi:ATP-binding protein involved in chromosome partitioning